MGCQDGGPEQNLQSGSSLSLPARDAFWDAGRAVLMWLVILGHTIQELAAGNFFTHPLFKGIYLFHIPLFFFISGYFAYSSIKKHHWKSISRSAPVYCSIYTTRAAYPMQSI